MGKDIVLAYFSSDSIMVFCGNNPIRWGTREQADAGDLLTPTPAMAEFFRLLTKTGNLPTQKEYAEFCWQDWQTWRATLTDDQARGVSWRLYRNFYPSAIDSLHVWALLVESGRFDKCILDTADDACGKTDISVWPVMNGDPIKIALYSGSKESRRRTAYKRSHRGIVDPSAIDVILPMDRPKYPGNKRWYTMDDLQPVFAVLEERLSVA